LFRRYFQPEIVEQYFHIPPDYRIFLEHIRSSVQRGGIYGTTLHGTASVVTMTEHGCDLFANRWSLQALMVLEIGHWSDKHDIFLICDTRNPLYGAVLDCHDDHPWLDGGAVDVWTSDFTSLLQELQHD
jgi:hypothetical protein